MTSPTARTLQECRKREWPAGVVERWIPQAGRRIDLFGIIDLIALDGGCGCLGIQATSGPNVSSRIVKAMESEHLKPWLAASNRFEVWGWAKRGKAGKRKLWSVRRVELFHSAGKIIKVDYGEAERATPA